MNEEPTQTLSSKKFNLFDLNSHVKDSSGDTLAQANNHISFLENVNDVAPTLSKSLETTITTSQDIDKFQKTWPIGDEEADALFNLDEDLNIMNGVSDPTSSFSGINPDRPDVNNNSELCTDYEALQLNTRTNTAFNQLQLNSNKIKGLNENEYFTLTVRQTDSTQIDEHKNNNLTIESVSENIHSFLNINKENVINNRVSSIVIQNDLTKFHDLFQSLSQQMSDLTDNTFKLKPFVCQVYVNPPTGDDKDPVLNQSSNTFEPMILFPISINTKTNIQSSIQFAVKKLKNKANPANRIESNQEQQAPISNSPKPAVQTAGAAGTVLPFGFFSNPNNDFNMDQFKTRMTEKGLISSAETDNLKNCFNASDASGAGCNRTGFISDIRSGKSVNIFEYVHSNDQNHILQHIQNVISKSENTSAIYRLKINEKYAFLQTQSCLISKKDTKNDEGPIIYSIHSIIKEIDTDVEMKGNASTSLMKTLINKKPSLALNKSDQNKSKSSTSLNNILDSLAIEESTFNPVQSLASSQRRQHQQPASPIGTKFAMTMLGLPGSLAQHRNNKSKQKKEAEANNNGESNSNALLDGLLMDDTSPTDRKILSDTATTRNNNDEIYSSRKNSFLLKKLLSDGDNIEYVLTEHSELEEFISEEKNENSTENQPITSSPILSPVIAMGEEASTTANNNRHDQDSGKNNSYIASKAKDDIILRTLLNTADCEPQLLKLESVFELNPSAAKIQDIKKITKKISVMEPAGRKRKKLTSKSTDIKGQPDSDDSMPNAPDVKKVPAKRQSAKKSAKNTNSRRNPVTNMERGIYTNIISNEFMEGAQNNQLQSHDPMGNSVSAMSKLQVKPEKMNYPNYLNKENDSQKQIDYSDIYNNNTNQQQHTYSNNIINKKFKVDTNAYQMKTHQQQQQPSHHNTGTLRQNMEHQEITSTSFPSSLASSSISVSSTSSLSSPVPNPSSSLAGITLPMNNLDPLGHNHSANSPFLNFTDDIFDGFQLSNNHKTTSNKIRVSNGNEYDEAMFGQSSLPVNNANPVEQSHALNSKENEKTNIHNHQYGTSSQGMMEMSNANNKDDDLTKKKRIEAISKHLKSDLIESFKAAQPSPSGSAGYYEGLLQPASAMQQEQRIYHESLDQSFNESSVYINPGSNKGHAVNTQYKVDDTFVPNISIEPMILSQDGAKNKQLASKSISTKQNPELGLSSHHYPQMPGENPNNYMGMNQVQMQSHNTNLMKKLAEHIQQRNHHSYPQPPNTNMVSPNAFYQQQQQQQQLQAQQPYYNNDMPINSNPIHSSAQQYNPNPMTIASSNQPFSQPQQPATTYNQQLDSNFPVISMNKPDLQHPASIESQSSPHNPPLKSQYASHESLEVDIGMSTVNQPIDFNKKQFGSPVSKQRIYQTNTDLKQQYPYNNSNSSNNFSNDVYSAQNRPNSVDMHQQIEPVPHNQYQNNHYQHSYQQSAPYFNSSAPTAPLRNQLQSHVNQYPNQYHYQQHQQQQYGYQNPDPTRNSIGDDLQLNNYPTQVPLNNSPAQQPQHQMYNNQYHSYNNNTNSNGMYQNHPPNQKLNQMKSNAHYQTSYPQYDPTSANGYFEEDPKGSLLQQLLLDN